MPGWKRSLRRSAERSGSAAGVGAADVVKGPWLVSRHGRALALAAILLVALGFRLWGITWGLENATVSTRPHPDEWPVYWLFRWFGSTHSLNPCPGSGRCFFDWGMAFPYLAYALHFLIEPIVNILPISFGSHADPQFVQPVFASRLTSALVSTLTVGVVYLLGREAYSVGAGLLAALLLAISGLAIQLGHFATPDSTTLLLLSLTLLLAQRAMTNPSAGRFILAGMLLGLTAGSEYHMILLAIPIGCAWFLAHERRGDWLVLAGGAAGVAFLAVNPYVLPELPAFLSAIAHTARIRSVESGVQYQGRFDAYGPSWLFVVRYPLGYGIGFALTGWLVAGAFFSIFRRSRADYLLLSWTIPYFLLVTIEPAKFMRYSAPLLIPLALFGARFAVSVFSRIRTLRIERPPRRAALLAAGVSLAAGAILYTSIYDAAYVGVFASPDPRAVAVSWVADRAHQGASIGFSEKPDGLLNLPYYAQAAGLQPCIAEFKESKISGTAYVLSDRYAVEEHPGVLTADVKRYWQQLNTDPRFSRVLRIHMVPSFLGLRFSIDGSPHDWRYATHDISLYARKSAAGPDPPGCSGKL